MPKISERSHDVLHHIPTVLLITLSLDQSSNSNIPIKILFYAILPVLVKEPQLVPVEI
jgi:hypothetical protein